jgi:hypothetical protein
MNARQDDGFREGLKLNPGIGSSPSCPALCRASTSLLSNGKKGVDGRDKPGHDGKWNQFQAFSP